MNNNFKIDPIDEALKLIYLETCSTSDNSFSSFQLQSILSTEYEINISEKDKEIVLNRLKSYATSVSFGDLLLQAIMTKNITAQHLAKEVKIDEAIIDDLKQDRIFTNNIPVVFVKNILLALGISFNRAESAILKTFELLKSQTVVEALNFRSIHPTYRKEVYSYRGSWTNDMAEGRDLFENEEALKKYLFRLNELMNK